MLEYGLQFGGNSLRYEIFTQRTGGYEHKTQVHLKVLTAFDLTYLFDWN